VIKQLENSKSATQRQQNNIRDPVARLPLEHSSEIFRLCLPPFSTRPTLGAHNISMLLLDVCNTWTDIARATPALWSGIHLVIPGD
ncbi:hypothetical protein B0H13DRAFT_1452941, partial [Mycena leptocephala]